MSEGYGALSRSRHLIQLERYDAALDALAPAMRDPATEPEAWCLRTQAMLGKGDLRNALESARTAIAKDPHSEWPHRLHALTLQRGGNTKDALAAALEAARIAPEQVETMHVLAICQVNSRFKRDEALATARNLVAKHPHAPLAHQTMGVVSSVQGNWATAEHHFRESLRLQPDDADVAHALAEALHRQGKREQAGEALLAAARSDPTDKDVRKSLGRLGLPVLTFGGIGFLKAMVAVQGFRAFRFLHPAAGTVIVVALLIGVGGYLSISRIAGTRSLPENIHRGLMADHRNYALGWLSAAAFACLPLALWAAAAPPDQGQSHPLAIGLLVFFVVALGVVLTLWSGPLPNHFPTVTAWMERRRSRRG